MANAPFRRLLRRQMLRAFTAARAMPLIGSVAPGWELRRAHERNGWVNLRLIRTEITPADGYAVFSLAWNVEEQRLAQGKEYDRFREREPSLHEPLLAALMLAYGQSSL